MNSQLQDIVFSYLGKPVKLRGSQAQYRCPFHKEGREKHPSFGINLNTGIWNCFTCHASGSIGSLLTQLDVPAHKVQALLGDLPQILKEVSRKRCLEVRVESLTTDPFKAKVPLDNRVLKRYTQWKPDTLINAGFSDSLVQNLEIGVDTTNYRVMYPIKDIYGTLAGFSGGSLLPDQQPKYKVYNGAIRDDQTGKLLPSDYGEWFDEEYPMYGIFKNHDYLWNLHRVYPSLWHSADTNTYIVVTEGFKACMWLLQCGIWSTVALMGTAVTPKQQQYFLRLNCPIVMFLDNDIYGVRASVKYGKELQSKGKIVRIAYYPTLGDGKQPDSLTPDQVVHALSNSMTLSNFITRTNNEF